MSNDLKKVAETSAHDDEKKRQQAPTTAKLAANTDVAPPSNRPSVHFSVQPRRQHPQQVKNPAKVGKANPKRDIPIFLGLVGVLFLIAYGTSGIGGANEMEKKKSVKQIQEDIRKQFAAAQALENARKRTMECDLFLAPSSIPGTGLGIFAGKIYEVGDEVIHPGVFYPVDSEQGETMFISQYGFLLKHHPFLANLQGGPLWSNNADVSSVTTLRAARVIEPGEELFLSFEQHPQQQSDFISLPTLEDYELADEIVRDEIRTQRRGPAMRKAGSQAMGGGALMMVKRAVEKLNKKVAALLPGSTKVLGIRDGLASSSAFSALTNRTVHYLETNGQCLDDVYVKPGSSQLGLFAKRSIKKGNMIVPVPLYAIHRAGSCSVNPIQDELFPVEYCFGHKDSNLLLCPLSSAAYIQTTSGDGGSIAEANAALKWNSGINIKSIHKVSTEEILKNYTTSLRLDIIALRGIQPEEPIILKGVKDTVAGGGAIQVDDKIFSVTWKDYELSE